MSDNGSRSVVGGEKASSVRQWLEGSAGTTVDDQSMDNFSEGSEFGDANMSEFGDENDELTRYARQALVEAEVSEVSQETVGTVDSCLREVALAEQRMVAASMRKMYVRGRVHLDVVYGEKEQARQRLFMVNEYVQMSSLDDSVIYDRLSNSGRVVARLGAPTGMGKTTRLPGMIAKRCNLRVCLVETDANLAKMSMDYQKDRYGIPVSSRRWRREKTAFLAAISYDDFRGIVCSAGRKRFFSDFDVFVFDEPHLTTASVYLAKQYFGVYAMDHNSLLLVSATVSTRTDNDIVAQRVGKFEDEPVQGGMDGLVRSGKLVSQYVTDRTMVIVADNRRVYSAASYYDEAGCEVKLLDNGSSLRDVQNVVSWLTPAESAVPRILVAVQDYGTGYNFPVSYVVTSATRVVYTMDGKGGLVENEVPLRDIEVQQHKGRTGRGLATGSGGIVASKVRDTASTELMRCEALKAYLGLIAADIQVRPGLFDDVKALVPRGLTRDVALSLLSIELPPALVLRYLGSDGRVASRFVKAMSLYIQPDHVLRPSVDVDPVGYSSWIEEKLGGYYTGDTSVSDVSVYVPFASPTSLRVIMHTLYAVGQKWMEVPVWRPEGVEDSASDDEDLGTRARQKSTVKPVKLRLVVDEETEVKPVVPEKSGWTYDVDPDQLARRRRRQAMSWLNDQDGATSVESLKKRAEDRRSFGPVSANVIRENDEKGERVVISQSPGQPVDLDSPGGSLVVKLPAVIYEAMSLGVVLTPGYFVDILRTVKQVGDKFAKSTLFSDWSAPWLSVLRTYADSECVDYAIRKNYRHQLPRLIGYLYDRFRVEVIAVCTTSNLYAKKVKPFFGTGKVSTTRLMKYIDQGRIPIAQSDKFISRCKEIKEAHTKALAGLEARGVFAPHVVTSTQRSLPLRSKAGRMPVVGEDVVLPAEYESTW